MSEEYQDWLFFPTIEIVDYLYSKISNSTHLQTRIIDSIEKTTSFYDYLHFGDIAKREQGYTCPIICVGSPQKADIKQESESQERIGKYLSIVDCAISHRDRRTVYIECFKFSEDIIKVISAYKRDGNLRTRVTQQINFNPYANNDLEEMVIRHIVETEYR
jgi:hypothetical protein